MIDMAKLTRLTESEESIVQEFFKDQPMGRFLELGAKDGEPGGSSEPCWNLLIKGWAGYYCEPNPISCASLIENIWPYKNQVQIFNGAVTGTTRFGALNMSLEYEYSSCSSLVPNWINRQSFVTTDPSLVSLDTNCIGFGSLLAHIGINFDFVSIDIEGSDEEVITSVDWNRFTDLKLICLENPSQVSISQVGQAGFAPIGITKHLNMLFTKKIG